MTADAKADLELVRQEIEAVPLRDIGESYFESGTSNNAWPAPGMRPSLRRPTLTSRAPSAPLTPVGSRRQGVLSGVLGRCGGRAGTLLLVAGS
ncbi:hypothetical protein Misp01_77910 [Microtetraspora sp. NBRC 13810]|nr:hypothetical protein Misp01_77910 [Microtetraspora sp. NBRC 13810]